MSFQQSMSSQQSARRSVTRDISNYLNNGHLIRHVYRERIIYARYAQIYTTRYKSRKFGYVDYSPAKCGVRNFLILCSHQQNRDEILNCFDQERHAHYKSLSGFANAHKNVIDPSKKHISSNGWKECEILTTGGVWTSIARIYP